MTECGTWNSPHDFQPSGPWYKPAVCSVCGYQYTPVL